MSSQSSTLSNFIPKLLQQFYAFALIFYSNQSKSTSSSIISLYICLHLSFQTYFQSLKHQSFWMKLPQQYFEAFQIIEIERPLELLTKGCNRSTKLARFLRSEERRMNKVWYNLIDGLSSQIYNWDSWSFSDYDYFMKDGERVNYCFSESKLQLVFASSFIISELLSFVPFPYFPTFLQFYQSIKSFIFLTSSINLLPTSPQLSPQYSPSNTTQKQLKGLYISITNDNSVSYNQLDLLSFKDTNIINIITTIMILFLQLCKNLILFFALSLLKSIMRFKCLVIKYFFWFVLLLYSIKQNRQIICFQTSYWHIFLSKSMSEDVDYEPDVLKFKQVWGDNKNPDQTGIDPKNLQTIQSNAKNTKKKVSVQGKKQPQQQQKQQPKTSAKKAVSSVTKPGKKQSTQGHKAPVRNPRPNYEEVIEVSTQPTKFFTSNLNNEKNNIAQSHLYLDKGDKGASDGTLLMGVSSAYEFKKMLEEKDYELSMLRVANSRTEDRVRYLERELEKKNQTISQLRERERKMIEKNCSLQSKEFNFDLGKAEYENFRNDSRRLLKMLQATSQYQDFAKFALDDDGVRFLHHANKNQKTKIDSPPKNPLQTIHFCTCNKAFIPQSGFWVPQKVYSFGKQFVKDRNGQLTEPELELMLYELNRIWREREKRIVNTYSAMKAHEVGKYKRKLQSLSKQNRAKSQKQADNNPNNEE